MMKKFSRLSLAAITAVALLGASVANAAVVLSENFNSEHGGTGILNYGNFTNWSVPAGSVDLIGNGYYDLLPGNGLYVDLNGSTGQAGTLRSTIALAPGSYHLTFSFAGSQRGLDGKVSVSLGDSTSAPIILPSNTGFTTQSIDLNPTQNNNYLTFQSFNTGNGNVGGLLDNVVLESVPNNNVPEPASLALLGAGLLGLGLMRRRKRG